VSPVRVKDVDALARSITAQFDVVMGHAGQVALDCRELRNLLSSPLNVSDIQHLQQLLPLLRTRTGEIPAALFEVFEEATKAAEDPWFLLEGMLSARENSLVLRALERLFQLVEAGSLTPNRSIIRFLAERSEVEGSPLAEREALSKMARIVRGLHLSPGESTADPCWALFGRDQEARVRRLAARILDLDDIPVTPELVSQWMAPDALGFLAPYLTYTRASHLDLYYLIPAPGKAPPVLTQLRQAEALLGEPLLRELISRVGWPRLNMGLQVQRYEGVSVAGSLSLMLSEAEAAFLEHCGDVRRVSSQYLVIAHGGEPGEGRRDGEGTSPINRFRTYNLIHADILGDFLDVAPLTVKKVRGILQRMDQIVEDYLALFSAHTEECSILASLYRDLKDRIEKELTGAPDQPQLSVELTRLAQMFEDPRSLGEVRTLHGLKRYLHQKGLQLGSKLVEAGASQSRSVDLIVCSGGKVQSVTGKIQYSDFEPETEEGDPTQIPYSIAVVAEGFARQLLHGQKDFPSVKIFCYGNEVHYYLAFRNHPAFLRIDYSPPLRGGMIDLEYFGVSKFELSDHPNIELDAIRSFFRHLDFDIDIDTTRVHARYDKERASDMGSLCEKAEMMFCLAPYLMDVDWIIGSFQLDREARRKVGEAWGEVFQRWGVLPLRQLLTKDQMGILEALVSGPTGENEVRWSGNGPYRDRFSASPPPGFYTSLHSALERLKIDVPQLLAQDGPGSLGQVQLERRLLHLLRAALRRGQIMATTDGFQLAPLELFKPVHEAEEFAALLASGVQTVSHAVQIARLVAPLERMLNFRATGGVEAWNVQYAKLTLRGLSLGLYVLRDTQGIIRIAFFTRDQVPCRHRNRSSDPWISSVNADPVELASMLRRNNYTVTEYQLSEEETRQEAIKILAEAGRGTPRLRRGRLPGERLVTGLGASPGRAVGRVLFGTMGRAPEDFDNAILVAQAVRPEDMVFLYHCAGVVSTGGGILSHAGLIALQFRKPALIIEGRWQHEADGSCSLRYVTQEYQEEEREVAGYHVFVRENLRECEYVLCEGDLVVMDAGEGTLRLLGQQSDVLVLHDSFQHFSKTSYSLSVASDEKIILALRGRQLRARHQIEKILKRLSDVLLADHAVYEILLRGSLSGDVGAAKERTYLLELILANPHVGRAARDSLLQISGELTRRFNAACETAQKIIPTASSLWEILSLRLEVLRLQQALKGAVDSLLACGIEVPSAASPLVDIDGLAHSRLEDLLRSFLKVGESMLKSGQDEPRLRYVCGSLERLLQLEGTCPEGNPVIKKMRQRLSAADDSSRERGAMRRVIGSEEGGFEMAPLIGWKAVNLAEIERLVGRGWVPPWFVVTHRAFEEVLDAPLNEIAPAFMEIPAKAPTLRQAIQLVLAQPHLDSAQKSAHIRALWDGITLPDELAREVREAYRCIRQSSPPENAPPEAAGETFVAIRSSAREEDTEAAARAGEFETFLFISGEQSVLEHLKRTWSGLWTARAIHNRSILGDDASRSAGGGVIIQRIAWSRASGVLQTVNAAQGDLREMVINAGHGLGEGIVSGLVAADQITVIKGGDLVHGPLRFRYVTSDKRERVVFNQRTGQGTVRTETLYHQRLRPALEYVELCELVAVAARLEEAYGYPLDLEFGIEGTKLWILQARPVPSVFSSLRETLERYPLGNPDIAFSLSGHERRTL
jgi:pyruvate,water dikinase